MTEQPQYPQQYPQGYGPPPQQPGYGYPPQGSVWDTQGQQPYPPQQPQYQQPPQGYYPPQQPQQYGPPPQQQPQGQPMASGSIDAFFSQPSAGGGPGWKFEQPGTTRVGVVARAVTNADIQQQTNPGNGQPAFFKDGRPKFVMKVPMLVEQSEDNPEGRAQWFCAGSARDELARAMGEAGAPAGPPEPGAMISVTFTGTRPSGPGMNPAKVFQVTYQRPQGAAQAPAPAPEQPQPEPQAAAQEAPQAPQGLPEPPAAPQQSAPSAPQASAAPAPATPDSLSPDQAAVFARITQQQSQG